MATEGRAPEFGATLIEVLLTAVILGTSVLALLGGFLTVQITTTTHRDHVSASALLTTYVENLEAGAYQPCATPSTFGNADTAAFTVRVTEVAVWNGNAGDAGFIPSSSGCVDTGLQRVTVVVTQVDHETREQAQVFLRARNR